MGSIQIKEKNGKKYDYVYYENRRRADVYCGVYGTNYSKSTTRKSEIAELVHARNTINDRVTVLTKSREG